MTTLLLIHTPLRPLSIRHFVCFSQCGFFFSHLTLQQQSSSGRLAILSWQITNSPFSPQYILKYWFCQVNADVCHTHPIRIFLPGNVVWTPISHPAVSPPSLIAAVCQLLYLGRSFQIRCFLENEMDTVFYFFEIYVNAHSLKFFVKFTFLYQMLSFINPHFKDTELFLFETLVSE